jgi:hypothetical protein
MVCATYLDDPSEPSYIVEFKDWKLNESAAPSAFTFTNTTGASEIEFRDPVQPTGASITGSAAKQ